MELYSDKLRLSVENSTQIDRLASLFKGKTWAELSRLTENNEYLKEATETIDQLSPEEEIRQQCEAREDYYRRMRGIGRTLAKQTKELKEKDAIIAEKDALIFYFTSFLSNFRICKA